VGHETTASALAWAFERLVRHPEALARLRTGVRPSPSRRANLADPRSSGEDLQQGDAYLDAVIKETLRLRPVLPIVVRVLKEPTEFGDYVLPAGVAVAPCIYLVHRRDDTYPQPTRFCPERFLARPQGAYTWIPFGGGVRRCLGSSFALMEMAVVIRTVLQTVDLVPADARPERPVRRAIALVPDRRTQVVVAR
jgi:cytochrome P450 family 135